MKTSWYVNWLVVITVCLSLSVVGLFILTIQNSLGLTKCAYGDIVFDGEKNCMCDSKGNVVCDEKDMGSIIKSEDFSTENLSFTYEFQNALTSKESFPRDIRFVNISQVGTTLKVVTEKTTVCNRGNNVAPQVGFYKFEENRLILTIGSNLFDKAFTIPCISESTFEISNVPVRFSDNFKLFYQDEFGSLIPSGNCSYEGFLRNEGDVYNSSDGCSLCACKLGQNICEKEERCLK